MKSLVAKRSVVIAGHKTSVSLEDGFWKSLQEIANERDMTPPDLIGEIDSEREHANLSSALRLFVLDFYRDQNCGGRWNSLSLWRAPMWDRGPPSQDGELRG